MKARRKVCREAMVRGIGPLEGSQAFVPNVRGMLAKAFRAATVVAVFGLVIYASHSHGVPDSFPLRPSTGGSYSTPSVRQSCWPRSVWCSL